MSDPEKEIQRLEAAFASLSGVAFSEARKRVLASGQSVLQSEGGHIYRVFPDGRKELVKEIEPPITVTPGTKITLR